MKWGWGDALFFSNHWTPFDARERIEEGKRGGGEKMELRVGVVGAPGAGKTTFAAKRRRLLAFKTLDPAEGFRPTGAERFMAHYFIEEVLDDRYDADVLVFLWDMNRGAFDAADRVLERVLETGAPYVVVLNKVDVAGIDWGGAARASSRAIDGVSSAPVRVASGLTGEGVDEAFETARRLFVAERAFTEHFVRSRAALAVPRAIARSAAAAVASAASDNATASVGFEFHAHAASVRTLVFTDYQTTREALRSGTMPSNVFRRALFWFEEDTEWNEGRLEGRYYEHESYVEASLWLSGRRRSPRPRLLFAPLRTDTTYWRARGETRVALALDRGDFSAAAAQALLAAPAPAAPLRRGHAANPAYAPATLPAAATVADWARAYSRFAQSLAHLEARRRSFALEGVEPWDVYALLREGPVATLLTLTRTDDAVVRAAPLPYTGVTSFLGAGAFGCVVRVTAGRGHPLQGEAIALKVQEATGNRVASEATILGLAARAPDEIAHASPYVPQLFGAYRLVGSAASTRQLLRKVQAACGPSAIPMVAGNLMVLEMPVYDGGTLLDAAGRGASDRDVRGWFFQLTHSLTALDAILGFAHLDLKPRNILVRSWNARTDGGAFVTAVRTSLGIFRHAVRTDTIAAFADLGFAGILRVPALMPTTLLASSALSVYRSGTFGFISPTLFVYLDVAQSTAANIEKFGRLYPRGMESDIWALGITFLEILWVRARRDLPADLPRTSPEVHDPVAGLLAGQDLRTALNAVIDDLFAQPAYLGGYKEVFYDTEAQSVTREMQFYASYIGIYAALNGGRLPAVTGAGQVFAAYVDAFDAWGAAIRRWPGSRGRTPYDLVVQSIDWPEALEFVRACLSFDPVDREAFFRSGAAVASDFFNEFATEEVGEYKMSL